MRWEVLVVVERVGDERNGVRSGKIDDDDLGKGVCMEGEDGVDMVGSEG